MPPRDSDIDCKACDGGVVIRIPPVGLWRAGGVGAFGVGSFVGIAILLGAFAALLTIAAMIGSLIAFTLSHAPVLLDGHFETWAELFRALLWTIPFGLVLSITFLVTQNLFVSVGLHALWNSPTLIVPAKYQQIENVWWVLSVALIAGWWIWLKVRSKPKLP